MKEKFPTIASKVNRPITFLLMGIIWITVIAIIVVIGVVFENIYKNISYYLEHDAGIFFGLILALIVLVFCCVALIISLTRSKKEKIRKAIIDEKGVSFYNSSGHILSTILYSELQRSKNTSDDAHMYSTTGKYSKSYLNIYLTSNSGDNIIMRTIDFNFEYVVLSNQIELYCHFLRGIQHFRPDLRISAKTIKEYNLNSNPTPVKAFGVFEWIISVLFIVAILGIIYALIILLTSVF